MYKISHYLLLSFVIFTSSSLAAVSLPYSLQSGTPNSTELREGMFSGKTDHRTVGRVTIEKDEEGFLVVFADDFDFSGSPDPRVAFGKDGFKKETLISKLKNDTGRQVYRVPEGINPLEHNEIWIWCFKERP